ncbi:uncharacterized protein [Clytia hemisphaerica]|uniref:uncharacterized protein isoform X1 n=1 Tax=Clytia hemisphaerica TaxID=252671 RepID=UPI0034D50FF0
MVIFNLFKPYLLASLFMVNVGNVSSQCQSSSNQPLNDHGIPPFVLVPKEKEIEVTKGLLLALLPTLSAEWIVSMKLRLFRELDTSFTFCRLFHMTKGGQNTVYGDRTPLVSIRTADNVLQISTALNGKKSHNALLISNELQINQTIALEIHQRYVKNGNYKYYILVDGVVIMDDMNYTAEQFHDVKVYATSYGETFWPTTEQSWSGPVCVDLRRERN